LAVVGWVAHAIGGWPGPEPTNSARDQDRQSKQKLKLEDKVKKRIKKHKICTWCLNFTEQQLMQPSSRWY
jgi:hypothetical protein